MKKLSWAIIASLFMIACNNSSDSTGTTIDSTAIEAAADSAAKVAGDAAKAIDSTVQAALDSTAVDSVRQ